MSDRLFARATAVLKKSVALMMKHKIAATPHNYALWYLYVENNKDELKQAMEQTLDTYQTIPPSQGDQLYNQFIEEEQNLEVKEMRQNLEAMVQELQHTMRDTGTDTANFQSTIDSSFDKLENAERDGMALDQVMDLVRHLIDQAATIRKSTNFFNEQLSSAQEEISKLKDQLKQTEEQAMHDALTGIYNRRAFDLDYQQLLQHKREFAVIACDIDHFKAFNDNYGHVLGDQVLKVVAKRLNEGCREGMKVYRYGGEEFMVLMPDADLRKARYLAETMRRAIEKLSLKDRRANRQIKNITTSFGVAVFDKLAPKRSPVEEADKQLYEAKRLGRNRVMPILN
ncbi:GGDEF domain-containing protein [Aliagarivorans marinus]|uniref:GGDEF domain-containing protein n=1 Tax=Aliagarivorans marinus TaxID=561965 RepID=UPI00047C4C9A|nr:GGDEF domain-containing protein [Aliagarivorans marinus]